MEQLGIIGAGPGGAALLAAFLATPGVQVIGIADVDPNSPGLVLARERRIFTTADFRDLVRKPGRKILFDATGVAKVAQELEKIADEQNIIVCPHTAKLIWQMVEAKEKINNELIQESSTLLSFIENGLEHLEVLNTEHSNALHKVVGKIESLSQATTASHALLQETEDIILLIKNVADKTRILGINAAIESARAGEFGRGFGVVADSIHELAASSVRSVQSVSGTIRAIHDALQGISKNVDELVHQIQQIKSNQDTLTQELHASLEEMGTSAEKLKIIAGKG